MKKTVSKVTERFLELSKPEQRVKIAKDVISQIKAQKVYITTGTYMDFQYDNDLTLDAQCNLDKVGTCRCCALGSTMLSLTKFANTLTLGQLENFPKSRKAITMLKKYFTLKQLSLIEYAFEAFGKRFSDTIHDGIANDEGYSIQEEDYNACIEFYNKYPEAEKRLLAIMKNIVKNSGTFQP